MTQLHDASFLGKFYVPSDMEWLAYLDDTTHQIHFSVNATNNTTTTVTSTVAVSDITSWYFVAVGWDGTNIKISVNGGPYITAPFVGPVFSGTGIRFYLGSEGGSQPWNGNIDEVAIWIGRNDLTISDVQQLYNNGAGLPLSSFQ